VKKDLVCNSSPRNVAICNVLLLAQNLSAAEQRIIANADRERADIVAKYTLVCLITQN
jgi:hypothetical protein